MLTELMLGRCGELWHPIVKSPDHGTKQLNHDWYEKKMPRIRVKDGLVVALIAMVSYGSVRALRAEPHVATKPMAGLVAEAVGGGIRLGEGPTAVVIVGDFGCAGCKQVEQLVVPTLRNLAERDLITLVYIYGPSPQASQIDDPARSVLCTEAIGEDPWVIHEAYFQSESQVRLSPSVSACASSDQGADLRDGALAAARLLGVVRYPTVFVDDDLLIYSGPHTRILEYVLDVVARNGED